MEFTFSDDTALFLLKEIVEKPELLPNLQKFRLVRTEFKNEFDELLKTINVLASQEKCDEAKAKLKALHVTLKEILEEGTK